MELYFLGAAQTVTGSKYVLKIQNLKIMIDCGLFQGPKNLRLKNWGKSSIDPKDIDVLILTHAHIDHAGLIPRFVKDGFKGKIYCTPPTQDLCEILLKDSGHLMEEEAEFLNKHKKSKHDPALPLFTIKDAEDSLRQFHPVEFNIRTELSSDINFEFHYAGHILGAASVIIENKGTRIAFTGDIGRASDPIFYPPEPLTQVDYLVTESTYGNRLHKKEDPIEELAVVINETVSRGGVILVPTFAVGRAQSILYYLSVLKRLKRIPEIPMYLNSPMAMNVGRIFLKYKEHHRLTAKECEEATNVVQYINSVEESKALNNQKGPMLIISASGMLTGGRILHHLKAFAPYPQNTILLTGFQSAGTRGEALLNNAEEIKIHGQYIKVMAQVRALSDTSAHADYKEIIDWFLRSKISPKQVFVTHGEVSAADELRRRITEAFGWYCAVPQQDEVAHLKC